MRVGMIRTATVAGLLAMAGTTVVATPAVAAQSAPSHSQEAAARARLGTLTSSVTGTFTDALGGTGIVSGTFAPSRFVARNGQLLATGRLTSTLTDSAGNQVGTATRTVTVPVQVPASSVDSFAPCEILNLVLGPLDLDLLGLQVHLDRVVLNITAQSGPGNLLGNLLCAVAGLLDGAGALSSIAALLNQILALLRL